MGILKSISQIGKLAFGENDFVKSFMDESFWKKEDYEKTIAENTRKMADLQAERNRLLEELARHGK